jgi:hypothetical protein
MAGSVVFEIDTKPFDEIANKLAAVGKNINPALARAVNHTGDKARTQVARTLAKQTGANYGAVRKALGTKLASPSTLVYRIIGTGGYMSLKEFGARQARSGVSAAPWGKRRLFPHTFIVGTLGGHVFVRKSKWDGHIGPSDRHVFIRKGKGKARIHKLWGPAIPKEMVKGQSRQTFETTVASELPARVEHEISVILSGTVR